MGFLFLESCFRCGESLTREQIVRRNSTDYCARCANYVRKFKRDPWPKKRVDWILPRPEIAQLGQELAETISRAQDERPIQVFLEKNPWFLVQLFSYGHGRWVFPRPRLGSEHIPDFMVCGQDSAGPYWHLIELESPTLSVLRNDGQPRAAFTHASQQISDWRIWLRKNCQYAQSELGYTGLDADFQAIIIMGRRGQLRAEDGARYRELSRAGLEVMSYDRLSEQVLGATQSWEDVLRRSGKR
jgi:hypothetical protein